MTTGSDWRWVGTVLAVDSVVSLTPCHRMLLPIRRILRAAKLCAALAVLGAGSMNPVLAADTDSRAGGDSAREPAPEPSSTSASNAVSASSAESAADRAPGASTRAPVSGGATFTRRPRWELLLSAGYFAGHDYPASADPNRRALALPFFIYRSERFRVGGGGFSAVAIERPRLRLDVSLGASLGASSEGNGSRAGMPRVDNLFELGPQLEVSWIDRQMASGGRLQVGFSGELRAVFATDFRGVEATGFVGELGADLTRRGFLNPRLDVITTLGVTFADERLQDLFYEVAPEFETERRARYDAGGGYLATELTVGLGIRVYRNVQVVMGLRTGLYAGAANERSPLFETTSNTGFGAGIVWRVASSRRLIDVIERD